MTNPLPQLAFGTLPPQLADEQQWITNQQLPTHLQPRQQQQMNNYRPWQRQQMNYQQQQPTQLQPGRDVSDREWKHVSYQLQQAHQQLNQLQQNQLQQLQRGQQQQTQDEMKTLWVGGLQYWMDETYLYHCFSHTGHVCTVQHVRHKQTGYSEGYGLVEFTSQAAAEKILQGYNGLLMPHTEYQPFKLLWASSKTGQINFRPEAAPEYSRFEGNLAPGVTNQRMLQETPRPRPEDSLSEAELAPSVTDHGLLQQTPETGPEFSLFAGDLFRTGYPPAKKELVKAEVDSASPTNSTIQRTTEEIASPFDQVFALPDFCAVWRNRGRIL